MRRDMYRMDRERALALLARAPAVHLASVTPEGRPVLRAVHGVIVDGMLAFHGAPAGEKMDIIDQPAVAAADEIVAEIPSHFTDPQRACPATTYYESVQIHGVIRRIDDAAQKARVLTALMNRFQPEGGFVPIRADHPLYRKQVAGILVCGMALEHVDGKGKLGQNRSTEELRVIMEKLWQRGQPMDVRAIDRIRAANPEVPTPAFLQAPDGVTLCCALDARDGDAVVELLRDTYWNVGIPDEEIRRAQLGSNAWVGARDAQGRLIASARALGDSAKWATVYDVIVAPEWRGRGVGKALLRLILDHPAVRACGKVLLRTKDAQGLYRQFGFTERPSSTTGSVEMVKVRA